MNEIANLTRMECRRCFFNLRFYLVLLLTFCIIFINQSGISGYLNAKGLQIQLVELYGFTLSDTFLEKELILLYTFMMCDLPFFHDGMDMELIRTTRKKWLISRLIVSFFLTFIWLLFIELCIIIVNAGYFYTENTWSLYLKTAARTSAGESIGLNLNLSIDVMTRFSPTEIFLLSFLYHLLFYNFSGLSILFINLWSKKNIGCIATISYAGLRFINRALYNFPIMKMLSPADLIDISEQTLAPTNIIYVVLYFIVLDILIFTAILFCLNKMDFTK